MDVIVSDFDNTLFKRNYGLINPVVRYLEERGLPVVIVTYRDSSQQEFIQTTLAQTKLDVILIGFGGSRSKDPLVKFVIVKQIMKKYNVVEALDDDEDVVLGYRSLGITARQAYTGVAQ